jgi:hypothetical protein
MVEKVGKEVEKGRVEKVEENGEKGKNKPIEAVSIPTTNGFLNVSVWEGGKVSFRVTRKGEDGEYETVWTSRVNPIDFLQIFSDLEKVRDAVRGEVKKLLGEL